MINSYGNFIGPSVLLLFSVVILEGKANDCYSCRGINCQRSARFNDTTTCPDQWDNCVTIFSGLTVQERGCFSNIPETNRKKCEDLSSAECITCFGDRCNNRSVARCIHCNSKNNLDCLAKPDRLTPRFCPLAASVNTYCFIYLHQNNGLERGCLTEIVKQMECLKDPLCSMCLPTAGVPCNNQVQTIVTSGSSEPTFMVFVILATLVVADLLK